MTRIDKSLRVVGPYKGISGYERHVRAFVRQFARLGVQVELRELRGWSRPLPDEKRDLWFDTLSAPVDAGTALHFTMPPDLRPFPGMRNVHHTMFEATRIPRPWVARSALADRILLPTESSRLAWAESGVPEEKLGIAPLGVDASFFAAPSEPLALMVGERPVSSFRCRFLNIAALQHRKNHLGLIRTWYRATTPDDDAVLVLKTMITDRKTANLLMGDIDSIARAMGRGIKSCAPIVILTNPLNDEEIRSLYRACSHYISMSKGEGWDLPMMEAAAAGLRLIAPNHSAYQAYLRDEDAELLPSRVVPAACEGRVGRGGMELFQGLSWWQPDEDAAVDVLRRIISGRGPEKPSPQARIASEYNWERSAKALLAALQD